MLLIIYVLVTYGDDSAVFEIETGKLLGGHLKAPQMRIVKKVLQNDYNRKELIRCWDYLNQENVSQACTPIQFRL